MKVQIFEGESLPDLQDEINYWLSDICINLIHECIDSCITDEGIIYIVMITYEEISKSFIVPLLDSEGI